MDIDKIIPFYYNYTLEESDLEQKLWILNSNSHRFVCFTTIQDLLKIEILFPFVDIVNDSKLKFIVQTFNNMLKVNQNIQKVQIVTRTGGVLYKIFKNMGFEDTITIGKLTVLIKTIKI